MASIRKEITTIATPEQAWDALRDIGALHTRLVPGFVINTELEPDARIVTFANGMVVREPIVDINDADRRLVWSAEGAGLKHYNGAAQVTNINGTTKVIWTADFLPHEAASTVEGLMSQGIAVMKETLDRLAATASA